MGQTEGGNGEGGRATGETAGESEEGDDKATGRRQP